MMGGYIELEQTGHWRSSYTLLAEDTLGLTIACFFGRESN